MSAEQALAVTPTSTNESSLVQQDLELSGRISRAASEGAKFALLLAMLEQSPLKRPKVISEVPADPFSSQDSIDNQYRHYPLKTETQHWHKANVSAQLRDQQPIDDLRLWLAMHPDPLSLHNNKLQLSEEVIANTSYQTQLGLREVVQERELYADETQLFEVLESLPSNVTRVA